MLKHIKYLAVTVWNKNVPKHVIIQMIFKKLYTVLYKYIEMGDTNLHTLLLHTHTNNFF